MPFTLLRPLWLGLLLVLAGTATAQSPWLIPYGTGSCGSDFVPTLHTAGEMPVIGNAGFQLVSENLIGGTPGLFFLSNGSSSLPFLGMTLYLDPLLGFGVACQATGPGGARSGCINLSFPIPNNSALAGGKLFFQGFFLDASVKPSLLVHTHGLGLTIAQSISPDVAVIRDRWKYLAHFMGANPTRANQLGRAIWTANQMAGFSYVKTEQFTCWSESHWMVIVRHVQTGMEFCLIPGGSFRMGDINGTAKCSVYPPSRELPVRWVRIHPFLLARTELPQSAWQAVMGSNPSSFQGSSLPVETVSWNDAKAFCARTGLRLPSEAEWEYACRAGVEACYFFGVNYPNHADLGNYAWFSRNSGYRTNPVGRKLTNAFGLFDMTGNVHEWCGDFSVATSVNDYKCAPTDGRENLAGVSTRWVMRGGSWGDLECRFRSSWKASSTLPSSKTGIRPASQSL